MNTKEIMATVLFVVLTLVLGAACLINAFGWSIGYGVTGLVVYLGYRTAGPSR